MPAFANVLDRYRTRGTNPTLTDPTTFANAGDASALWDTRGVQGNVRVSDESANSLTTFYRGIQLISATIARLPFHVYRKTQNARVGTEIETPETYYLWGAPNDENTRLNLWRHVIADEVRGNGFIWVDKDDAGGIVGIYYLNRRRVRVGRASSGRKVYLIDGEIPMIDYKVGGEIVHFPNWGTGLVGYDIVLIAKDALALGLSAQAYASEYFNGDAVPPGYISTDQMLTPEESDRIEERWMRRRAGTRQARRVAVLSGGTKFITTQNDPEKSQVSTVRSFQGEEICRLLGIPPHMLGFNERNTSWGQGIAEMGRGFVVYTLGDHISAVEQGTDHNLLARELTRRYLKIDVDGLLRGTTLQRYQAHAVGWGRWLTTNDIREDEDLSPVDGGDTLAIPANLIPIERVGDNFPEAGPEPGSPTAPVPPQPPTQPSGGAGTPNNGGRPPG